MRRKKQTRERRIQREEPVLMAPDVRTGMCTSRIIYYFIRILVRALKR